MPRPARVCGLRYNGYMLNFPRPKLPSPPSPKLCWAYTLGGLVITTGIGAVFSQLPVQDSNLVLVFILYVLLIARFTTGSLYGLLASLASVLTFNWFFVEPHYTLKVRDPGYWLAFLTLAGTAVIISTLTSRMRAAQQLARQQEGEAQALYRLTSELLQADSEAAILQLTGRALRQTLGLHPRFLPLVDPSQAAAATNSPIHKRPSPHPEWVLANENEALARLRLPKSEYAALTPSQRELLTAIRNAASLALAHHRSLKAKSESLALAAQERERSTLLRSISHDLRTPLSAILGLCEMLKASQYDAQLVANTAGQIQREASGLHQLVENILSLTRLREGRIDVNKTPEPIEEVVGSALQTLRQRFPNRVNDWRVQVPEDLLLVPMDPVLISQVLLNLLENALHHTPPNRAIELIVNPAVTAGQAVIRFTVQDRGEGIAKADLPHLFEAFYTTRSRAADAQRGVGLGLAICQAIVEAHGGKIAAESRRGGGALFFFDLPLGDQPAAVPIPATAADATDATAAPDPNQEA